MRVRMHVQGDAAGGEQSGKKQKTDEEGKAAEGDKADAAAAANGPAVADAEAKEQPAAAADKAAAADGTAAAAADADKKPTEGAAAEADGAAAAAAEGGTSEGAAKEGDKDKEGGDKKDKESGDKDKKEEKTEKPRGPEKKKIVNRQLLAAFRWDRQMKFHDSRCQNPYVAQVVLQQCSSRSRTCSWTKQGGQLWLGQAVQHGSADESVQKG